VTSTEQAQSILQGVFMALELIPGQHYKINQNGSYLVIPGSGAPRWIIPEQSKYGESVLAQWRPYGVLSRYKWKILCLLYRLRLAHFVPGVCRINLVDDKLLDFRGSHIEVFPVIYVGTPGMQQKVVVTLIDAYSRESLFVLKVALSKGANKSLCREAAMLKQLAHMKVPDVPRLVKGDKDGKWILQSVLTGKPACRELTRHHIDWLLALPRSGKVTTMGKEAEILANFFELNEDELLVGCKATLRNAIDAIKVEDTIPLVLVHGDFAPWNIKKQVDCSLLVLDWEDARMEGLPFWDICHFYFIQAHLFDDGLPRAQLDVGIEVTRYIHQLGICEQVKIRLTILYCLHQILGNHNATTEYKRFLIGQLLGLCAK